MTDAYIVHLAFLIAVVFTFAISENAASEAVEGGQTWRLLCAGGVVAAVAILARLISLVVADGLRRDFARRDQWLRRFERLRTLHVLMWLVGTIGIMVCLDWARLVRYNWGCSRIFLLDDLLLLVPVVLPWLISWAAFYRVVRTDQLCIAAGNGAKPPARWCRRYVVLCARHYAGPILLPVLVVLVLQDLAELAAPTWQDASSAWPLYAGWLVVVIVAFPLVLRRLWSTEPLPAGPLRRRLASAAERAGLRVRDILVWRTDATMMNAAVVGVTPWLRCLLLTDGLLARLRDDEVEAVVLHEAAHLRRRHLLLRILVVVLPVWCGLFWQAAFPNTAEDLLAMFESLQATARLSGGLVVSLGFALYAMLALSWCSRLMEHDADLWASRFAESQAGGECARPQCLIDAMRKLAPENEGDRWAWLHPPVNRRIDLIQQALQRPAVARRYQARVTWLAWGLLGGMFAAPLILLFPLR